MALSEHEQRKLNEIERTLRSDDPGLATIMDSGAIWAHRRTNAVVMLVAGLVGLVGGVVITVSLPLVDVLTSVVGLVVIGDRRRAAPPGQSIPQVMPGGHDSWKTRSGMTTTASRQMFEVSSPLPNHRLLIMVGHALEGSVLGRVVSDAGLPAVPDDDS